MAQNVQIQNIVLENQNDDKVLKKEIVSHVYSAAEKRVIVVNDINFAENFLVYVDKITDVAINENSKEYKKYFNLSKINITNELFNTYDNYIKKKYEIDINYNALKIVKNYFN